MRYDAILMRAQQCKVILLTRQGTKSQWRTSKSVLLKEVFRKYKSESVSMSETRQIHKLQFPSSFPFWSPSSSINMQLTSRRVNEALNGELAIAPIIGFRPQNTSAIDAKPRTNSNDSKLFILLLSFVWTTFVCNLLFFVFCSSLYLFWPLLCSNIFYCFFFFFLFVITSTVVSKTK